MKHTNGTVPLSCAETILSEPALKKALRLAAEQEQRSLASMVAVMVQAHCILARITIGEPSATALAEHKPRK